MSRPFLFAVVLVCFCPLFACVLGWEVKPFTVDFPQAEVSRMLSLVNSTRIPSAPTFTGGNETYGITRDWLASMRDEWAGKYDWKAQQAYLNK